MSPRPRSTRAVRPHTRRRVQLLAASCVIPLALAGCEQADSRMDSVAEAHRKLTTLHAGGAYAAPASHRMSVYDDVVRTLEPAARDLETPARQAAARTLLAQARSGQGQIHAGEAASIEREALNIVSQIRASFDHLHVARQAHAAALSVYDPSGEYQDVERQLAEVQRGQAQQRERLRNLESRIADLQRQVDRELAQAGVHRQEEEALRVRAQDARATERAELIAQAVEAQRAADAHEAEAGRYQAQIAHISPERVEIDRRLELLETQTTLLQQSRREAESRHRLSQDEASRSRAASRQAAEEISRNIEDLDAMRQGALAEAYDRAERAYDSAIGAMRQAAQQQTGVEARGAAQVTLARLQQSLGDLRRSRVIGLDSYAALLERLASREAGLAQAGRYSELLNRVRQDRQRQHAAAISVYNEAAESFDRAGGRGDVREQLDRLVAGLRSEQPQQPMDGQSPDAYDDEY